MLGTLMQPLDILLAGLAAVGAGAVNALAGGGTLITFPTLTFLGVPAVAANVTNTVALCPGYFGATLAQRKDLRGQRRRLWGFLPAGALGGIVGGFLLLRSGERIFSALVPVLILAASGLIALQERVRAWLVRRNGGASGNARTWGALPVGVSAIYGGYFGAGLSVIVLAVLGLTQDDSLTRLNALKQAIALSVNVATAVFFLFAAPIVWPAAAVMAAGALAGGFLGGKLAGHVRPSVLRWTVVAIGIIVAIIYWLR